MTHIQPKDNKEYMMEDIVAWVRRTSDNSAELKTLMRMSTSDLTVLMLAVHKADQQSDEFKAAVTLGKLAKEDSY